MIATLVKGIYARLKGNGTNKANEENTDNVQEGRICNDEAIRSLKSEIHRELLDTLEIPSLDIEKIESISTSPEIKKTIRNKIASALHQYAGPYYLQDNTREELIEEIIDEVLGLGPLEDYVKDPDISEIMVVGCERIFIERNGRIEKTHKSFQSPIQLQTVIERIVSPLGRRVDESSPMVDARLVDGSRVNVVIPPQALNGPILTIRKFSKSVLTIEYLIEKGALNPEMARYMQQAVSQRKNIIVSGGTGSGKTTLLNVLSQFIDDDERIVTIEDAAELQLSQVHVCSLEARPANMEGKGEITIRDLVKNALRMRPDRIIVGEVRGGEALDMLQAMNTGHDGSLTTCHANSTQDSLSRLETMVLMANMDLPMSAIKSQIAAGIDIIIQLKRLKDGTRKVVEIVEVNGINNGEIQLNPMY